MRANLNENQSNHTKLSLQGHSDTPTQVEPEVNAARAMYGRVLANWASGLLELDRVGLRLPNWNQQVVAPDADDWSIAA